MVPACPGLIYLFSVSKYQNHFSDILVSFLTFKVTWLQALLSPFKSRLQRDPLCPPNNLSCYQVLLSVYQLPSAEINAFFMGYLESSWFFSFGAHSVRFFSMAAVPVTGNVFR